MREVKCALPVRPPIPLVHPNATWSPGYGDTQERPDVCGRDVIAATLPDVGVWCARELASIHGCRRTSDHEWHLPVQELRLNLGERGDGVAVLTYRHAPEVSPARCAELEASLPPRFRLRVFDELVGMMPDDVLEEMARDTDALLTMEVREMPLPELVDLAPLVRDPFVLSVGCRQFLLGDHPAVGPLLLHRARFEGAFGQPPRVRVDFFARPSWFRSHL